MCAILSPHGIKYPQTDWHAVKINQKSFFNSLYKLEAILNSNRIKKFKISTFYIMWILSIKILIKKERKYEYQNICRQWRNIIHPFLVQFSIFYSPDCVPVVEMGSVLPWAMVRERRWDSQFVSTQSLNALAPICQIREMYEFSTVSEKKWSPLK